MMEDAYIIKGGKKLSGEVVLSGSKNTALKTIIAALSFDSIVVIKNVPRIGDVHELIHLIKKLGVSVLFIDQNTLQIDPSTLQKNKVDMLHASKIRVSFMLLAPLLHRFDECYIPNPGGCRIGARPIDRIINGIRQLGAEAEYNHETGRYKIRRIKKTEGVFRFFKSTHTGTELLILYSVLGGGTVVIENAALEPEIDELIRFLNESGAKIERQGNTVKILGVSKLEQRKPFTISGDRNEAVTFAALSIATKGNVIIKGVSFLSLSAFIEKLKKAGGVVEEKAAGVFSFKFKDILRAVDVETGPYPGFMTDWQSNWAVLMTQAKGISHIRERVFEDRFSYVEELKKLGAKIDYLDCKVKNPKDYYYFNYDEKGIHSQCIKIHGGSKLHGGVLNITDLRAGATLVIAALTACGESVLSGVSVLERGYERFDEKVSSLGGTVKKT